MWVDADVIFTNNSCTFYEFLSFRHNVIFPGDFNSGVFLIRNCVWSLTFLENWFSLRSIYEKSNGHENTALGKLLFDDDWNRFIYATGLNSFGLINAYASAVPRLASWKPGF
jgi:hypothetical protein